MPPGCLQVYGAGWDPPKSAEGTAEQLAKPLSIIHHPWFSGGLGSVRFTVGLNDLKGLFQLK